MDAVSLWSLAEKCLNRLRDIQQYRDEDIPYIYNDLLNHCSVFVKGNENISRSRQETERTAITVMCVMLTSLMNAVEKGNEYEDFDNKAICVSIDRLLQDHPYYTMLMNAFFRRRTGNDGKKVVIAPSDPMDNSAILESMDDKAKQDMEAMKTRVLELTKGLKVYFKEKWNAWVSVWDEICKNTEFMQLLSSVDPKLSQVTHVFIEHINNLNEVNLRQVYTETFRDCKQLKYFDFNANGLRTLDEKSFMNVNNLSLIHSISGTITTIYASCFNNGFTSADPINLLIDGNVSFLGNRAFQGIGTPNLSIQIGTEDNPTKITYYGDQGNRAFRNADNKITSLIMYIDDSVINNSLYSSNNDYENLKLALFDTTNLEHLTVFKINDVDII